MKILKSAVFASALLVLTVAGLRVANAMSNPIITNISPNQGTTGTTITISGQNLAGASMVNFVGPNNTIVGSITIGYLQATSSTSLTFTIPSVFNSAQLVPGMAYEMEVMTPGGMTNGQTFILSGSTSPAEPTTNPPAPTTGNPMITSITQSKSTSGTNVIIDGQSLDGVESIQFINSSGVTVAFISDLSYVATDTDNNVTFTIPATIINALPSGTAYQIRIVTPGGTSNGQTFIMGGTSITPCHIECNISVPFTPAATSTSVTTSTSGTTSSSSTQVLQAQLNQLLTALLQLLQQAAQQGLISTSQLNSFLGAIPSQSSSQ